MPLTDGDLLAILDAEEGQCEGRSSSVLSEERKKALDYFNGEPFGNEIKGRSSVVSTEVADTILWIMPSLMRIFTAGDDVVEFEPNGPEDEEGAKQATDYVNWVLQRQSPNSGFCVLYDLIFDALLQKNGFAKAWVETREVTDRQEKLVDMGAAFAMVQQLLQDGYEIDEATEEAPEPGDVPEQPQQAPQMPPEGAAPMQGPMGAPPQAMQPPAPPMPPQPKLRIKASRTRKETKIRVGNVPPEEILVSKRARSMADAPFVAHKTARTLSSLIEDGYPRKKVEQIPLGNTTDSMEEQARRNDLDPTRNDDVSTDTSMREYDITEAYPLIDFDEDGIAERRKILYGGKVILENEPWEGPVPIITATPIRLPHRVFGKSVADLVTDLQLIKSTLWRQILDNLYLSNNPRNVVSDQVNLDDLLTVRPGGIVRLKNGAKPSDGHVLPLETPFVAGASFPMLEYIDNVRENRTGVTRYNQGTDANSLNKTATGINQIQQAANQRIELIARILAETGVKDLFKLILFLVNKHVDKAQTFRLRNKWIEVDPSQWRQLFDVRIDVALGTGNRDQMAAHVTNLMAVQEKIVAVQGGPNGPVVTWAEISHAARKLTENSGFKTSDSFFAEVTPEQGKAMAKAAGQAPSPEVQQAQAEMEIEKMRAEMDGVIAQRKVVADINAKQAETQADIQAQREKNAAEIQLAREKAAAELELKEREARAQASIAVFTARASAATAAKTAASKANGRAA